MTLGSEVQAYVGAEVLTCDPAIPGADTVVVAGGRILAVGDREDLLGQLPADAEVIDTGGRSIMPGLADTHVHLAGHALEALTVEVRDFYDPSFTSVDRVLAQIERSVTDVPPGQWVVATGSPMQEHRLLERRLPTLAEVDRVLPDNPGYVTFGAHVTMANSAALAAKGITAATPDPDGGHIVRDPSTGAPTGLLYERARFAVQGSLTKLFGPAAMVDGMEASVRAAAARGVTTIHDIVKYRDEVTAWQRLHEQGRLPIRVMMLIRAIESEFDVTAMPNLGLEAGFGGDRLWFGGAKVSIDGGFSSGSAAFNHEMCDHGEHSTAIIRIQKEELDRTVKLYHQAGVRMCVHAIGDRAADMALDAFEAAGPPNPALRHRVEHLGNFLFTPERRARTKALGLTPVPNASFLYFLGQQAWDLLGGGEESFQSFPFRTMLREGFHLSTGADGTGYWPVDALRDMSAMVERESFDGVTFSPEETLTPAEALYCQTMNAAWLGHRESVTGSLTPGKLADFVVADCDHFASLSGKEMRELVVTRTVVGGDTVWDHKTMPG